MSSIILHNKDNDTTTTLLSTNESNIKLTLPKTNGNLIISNEITDNKERRITVGPTGDFIDLQSAIEYCKKLRTITGLEQKFITINLQSDYIWKPYVQSGDNLEYIRVYGNNFSNPITVDKSIGSMPLFKIYNGGVSPIFFNLYFDLKSFTMSQYLFIVTNRSKLEISNLNLKGNSNLTSGVRLMLSEFNSCIKITNSFKLNWVTESSNMNTSWYIPSIFVVSTNSMLSISSASIKHILNTRVTNPMSFSMATCYTNGLFIMGGYSLDIVNNDPNINYLIFMPSHHGIMECPDGIINSFNTKSKQTYLLYAYESATINMNNTTIKSITSTNITMLAKMTSASDLNLTSLKNQSSVRTVSSQTNSFYNNGSIVAV